MIIRAQAFQRSKASSLPAGRIAYGCGARTRTTYRWLANEPCLVCEGCGESLYVNGPELARGLAAIEEAMAPIDEVTAELKGSD